MKFVEIAPDYFVNTNEIVQFKLVEDEHRGGWCWVFTLSSGKILFSIPFGSEGEAKTWLVDTFENLIPLSALLRKKHAGYKPD
jgi:hypothetical protein